MNKEQFPLCITETAGYATVYDAQGNTVEHLVDLEMGWTDTSTGNYHDPDKAVEDLGQMVDKLNAYYPSREIIEGLIGTVIMLRDILKELPCETDYKGMEDEEPIGIADRRITEARAFLNKSNNG